jgi:hypothetical protein
MDLQLSQAEWMVVAYAGFYYLHDFNLSAKLIKFK